MRPGRQRDAIDHAAAVAYHAVGVDPRVLRHAQRAVLAVQPPPAVVDDPAVAVARERAAARRQLADVKRALTEQREVERAARGAHGTLLVRRARGDRET